MSKRKRMEKPAPLEDILTDALRNAKIDINLDLCKLCNHWTDLMGPTISRNAKPAVIKGGMLIVLVSSTPWMQQLQFLKDDMIRKLNMELGRETVTEIRFKIGPIQ